YRYLSGERETRVVSVCGDNEHMVNPGLENGLKPAEIRDKLEDSGKVDVNEHLAHFRSGDAEFTVFRDGRAIVKAETPEEARSVYSRYVGL
ncbi:MAG: hypothetical protein ABEI07_02225, partial [Candidatus Nanohaloarchaea archaeon]